MDYVEFIQEFYKGHVPEILLLVSGILALLMVYYYVKDDSSKKYKAFMVLGVIFGAFMILTTFSQYSKWTLFTSVIIALLGFTMLIRPFRKVEFAVFLGLIVIIISYILLARFAGIQYIEVIASGWPRVIVAFVLGALVYMMASFAEKIVMMFGKLFNWWPLLAILALLSVAEALCLLITGTSLYGFLR